MWCICWSTTCSLVRPLQAVVLCCFSSLPVSRVSSHRQRDRAQLSHSPTCTFTRRAELGALYKLLTRVPRGLKTLCECLSAYLRRKGRDIVENEEKLKKPLEYIQVCVYVNV